MLEAEPKIIDTYVASGDVQIVFWPALDGVEKATETHVMAQCMGEQSAELFWHAHDYIFANQRDFFRADRQFFVETAVMLGADKAAFTQCFDSGEGLAQVTALDKIRAERGVVGRPVFDIGEVRLFGSQPYETYAEAIETALASE